MALSEVSEPRFVGLTAPRRRPVLPRWNMYSQYYVVQAFSPPGETRALQKVLVVQQTNNLPP